jgi:hypothetical protein
VRERYDYYFVSCNFCGVHQTLPVTPVMEAGMSGHVRYNPSHESPKPIT